MGKGDIKTRKGKRTAGSYGVSRPRKKAKAVVVAKPKAKKAAPKKAAPKKAAAKTTAKKTTTKKTTASKTAAKK